MVQFRDQSIHLGKGRVWILDQDPRGKCLFGIRPSAKNTKSPSGRVKIKYLCKLCV